MINIPGYQVIRTLVQSSGFILFRARSLDTGAVVLVKTPADPLPRGRAELRHEYDLAGDLDMEGVLRPLLLRAYGGGLALILEDFNGRPLKEVIAGRGIDVTSFLNMAEALTETIGQLHHLDIIHQDVNTDHILVDPETGRTKLTGFRIASVLPKENREISGPAAREGNLAYISPEQTGRINRPVDHRADLYSLGVVFFEALTGTLPFQARDSLELVHSHIAREPGRPHEINPAVPRILSAITLKLMAKNPEDRYQGAPGLKRDLEECRRRFEETGRIDDFPLAQQDFSSKLKISQDLYGRDRETARLLDCFRRVRRGASEMALVTGRAGIGKTFLVNRISDEVARRGGRLISGKFEQFRRDTPYNALIFAFRDLVRQVMSENEDQLSKWRERLLSALDPNGRILVDYLPEMEALIGPQPEMPELGFTEYKSLFRLVMQRFIETFCRPDHPLVVFLDDLQWVDSATLALLKMIMTDPSTRHLLVIGAYRDNEIDPDHPLAETLENLRRLGASIEELTLHPLDLGHVQALIGDSLGLPPEVVAPLARITLEKTNGNPFFIGQLLTLLNREGLLTFVREASAWQWDLNGIKKIGVTSNVVDLLLSRLNRLSDETRRAIALASCIGAHFDLATMSIITEDSLTTTFHLLWPAVREGFIVVSSEDIALPGPGPEEIEANVGFAFLHDRVQQAAYTLFEPAEREAVHLQIGRLMLERYGREASPEEAVEIVNQMNQGHRLLSSASERTLLARLNLKAAGKAVKSGSYDAAFGCSRMAIDLLGDDAWSADYDLSLKAYLAAMEAAYLDGRYTDLESLFGAVTRHTRRVSEQAPAYECLMYALVAQKRMSEAVKAGEAI